MVFFMKILFLRRRLPTQYNFDKKMCDRCRIKRSLEQAINHNHSLQIMENEHLFLFRKKITKILEKHKFFEKFFMDSEPTLHALSPPINHFAW